MGLRINTNVPAMAAQRSMQQVRRVQDQSLERLASGSRITKAADDAAGLAISEKLKANIRGTRQASRNANDGISMIQVAEGGLNEISNILIRLRELSVQSSSDTIGEQERAFTDLEFQQLSKEIDRIAESSSFNGKSLLNGQGEQQDIQIGIFNNEKNDRISYSPQNSNATVASLGLEGLSVVTKEGAQTNLDKVDAAMQMVNGNRAVLGSLQSRLQSTVNNLEITTENMAAANSRIRDTDIAAETAELTKSNILNASNTSILAQANDIPTSALKLIG